MANRNTESHFSQIPRANIRRARFKRDYSNTTTINEGELVPIYVDEVLPGDTVSLTQNSLVRMATPIYPVMDNCYMDIYYFFCPNRLLWEHWENLMGQNDDILERFANGDTSVMRNNAQYIDATAMPSNFHEAYNMMNSQREKFDALPIEIKQKFGNDWVQWAAQSGTEDWLEKMGIKKDEPIKEEVKTENGES